MTPGGVDVLEKKRLTIWLAWTLAAVCLSGCSTIPKGAKPDDPIVSRPSSAVSESAPLRFSLGYSRTDSLNPYRAVSQVNRDMVPLLYEGLTKMGETMRAAPCLAADIQTRDALHPVATLRKDAVFSDGTPVTAADVAASFQLAKSSEAYAPLLSQVQSAKAEGDKVTFTLSMPDPFVEACLSFPVIKQAEGEKDRPIGTGPYVYAEGTPPSLKANTRHEGTLSIETAELCDISNSDAMLHGLENGSISYFFTDLTSGEIPRTTSANLTVSMNYLVFLGANSGRTALADARVRRAIGLAADRTDLSALAFAGYAEPAAAPFHPLFSGEETLSGFGTEEKIAEAVALLQEAGYNTGDKDSKKGKTLALELLVNEDNSFRSAAAERLKAQLDMVGVQLTIRTEAFDKYEQLLKSGSFDLYLGEIRLSANMSLLPFLSKNGKASYGVQTGGEAARAYTAFLNGEQSMAQFSAAFLADAPFIPLCWRKGMAVYNRAIHNVSPSALNVYAGIEGWDILE